MRVQGGLFDGYLGRLFRGASYPVKAGDVVDLPRMRVEVLAVSAAVPVPPSAIGLSMEGRARRP